MGTLISLPIIFLVKKLIGIHREINGRWISYLYNLIQLKLRNRSNPRFQVYDIYKNDPRHAGILPFDNEWSSELPSNDKSEDLLIWGTNSTNQSLSLFIKWRPKSVNNSNNNIKVKAGVKLRFDDNDGNSYTLDEDSIVDFSDKEYKVCGLGFQIMTPFRRNRLKFRGYLWKNNKQLVYVRIRFLCLALSKIYDFEKDFDNNFMAKEFTLSQQKLEMKFENRFEQFCQMKGTFQVENQSQKILYFWGSKAKKYLPKESQNRTIFRICGYNKKGYAFHIGLVSNNNKYEYRFGYLFAISGRFHKLQQISLSMSEFENLQTISSKVKFNAKFGDKDVIFEIEPQNSLAHKLILNGSEGMCFTFEENDNQIEKCSLIKDVNNKQSDTSLVLSLKEEAAKLVELSGGKGSSLSHLIGLSNKLSEEKYENNFNVPHGVVVTTNAYKELLRETNLEPEIVKLEKLANSQSRENLKTECENLVHLISKHNLPQTIRTQIQKLLKQSFNDYENKLFAVRSSASGEDSEEMSAAGQMTSYLGVKGLQEICDSVMKCWSSQFAFIPVEYKRGYGQPINSPMAVVIQEMVDCESAGVIFTCDPNTGDERFITITANYGLGESVVSATADPDTIKVSVNIKYNSLLKERSVNKIECKQIGAKKTAIKLLENGGVIEEEIIDNNNCCLSDRDLLRLADIAVKVHLYYGNSRDIEWGLKGDKLFMLQSRPITNLDNSFTEYEIMHEMDSAHNSEFEIYSRAYWGENFPGSSSWNVFSFLLANRSGSFRMVVQQGKAKEEDYNPFVPGMGIVCNQLMFNLTNGMAFGDMFAGYPENKRAHQIVMSFFGHEIKDIDVLNEFREKGKNQNKASIISKAKLLFAMIYMLLFAPKNLMKTKTEFMDKRKYDLVKDLIQFSTSKQIFDYLTEGYNKEERAFKNHRPISFGSFFKNMILKSALQSADPNNPFLEYDFNHLISSCNEVVNAEVPNNLKDIAKSIADKDTFKQLSDAEALQLLKNGTDEASQKFRQFLTKHGHRGYREIDPLHLPWGENPMPCIKTIKAMLTGDESALEPKKPKSVEKVMQELKTPLSYFKRLLISKFLLPWTRDGVRYREHSKYLMVWMNNKLRQAFWYLARKMVEEGLIPEADMFFYMTIEEIQKLCSGERDALILLKARLRKRIYPKMDKYKFDEFIKGPQMIPRNIEENIPKIDGSVNGSVKLSGTAVSNGKVKARVCVAEDISEADNIQPGDILITYSTDIGWSPYFPLISGIVTEIGGTISHGAVIAREFGIPCLIAVENACRTFTTGDICILDTETAQIIKV